jgi:hypothetical protein
MPTTYETIPTFSSTGNIAIYAHAGMEHVDQVCETLAGVRVSNVARYSGSTITIPTSIFTSDSDTRLLLNFGAAAAPVVHVGKYFYNNTDSNWHNLTNWSYDSGNSISAVVFPGIATEVDLKSTCLLKLDGVADNDANFSDWVSASSAYWAPPAKINTESNNMTFLSETFYNGGFGVPAFIPDTGNYALNVVVSYAGGYYQAIRPALNTGIVGDVPDPYYWVSTTHPYVDINIEGTGNLFFSGVDNLRP